MFAYSGNVRCATALLNKFNKHMNSPHARNFYGNIIMDNLKEKWKIALHICCALGHKELFEFLLTNLPVPYRHLPKPIYCEILQEKGISIPLFASFAGLDFGPLEVAIVRNQHALLSALVTCISVKQLLRKHNQLWTLKKPSSPKAKCCYRIQVEFQDIFGWL